MDDFDKGEKITMKRLEYWFKSFNSFTMANMKKNDSNGSFLTEADMKRLAENGSRFSDIIMFRIANKPNFDDDLWTLIKIEQTEEYQKWKRLKQARYSALNDGINKLKYSKA
jgi:hypothetical protein